jgi:microsomal dipeptidase-like Zn-dependent dipeptidase
VAATALAAFAAFFFFILPPIVADSQNPVAQKPPFQVSENARNLHQKLFIADLHADSLLWNRDLNEKSESGHVDFPRMRAGNVALQFFTVVTKSPRNLNIEQNSPDTDNIFWLALAQRQPLANLSSLLKRAVYQALMLREYAEKERGKFIIVKTKRDLAEFLERRRNEPDLIAGVLGIEGAHALDGKPENVDVLFEAGFRMMSPSHFFDSGMGGSVHGEEKYGLTEAGREMVLRMERRGMLVDLAHASARTIDDVLQMAKRPVVVSHTGVRGNCDNNRNLSDEQLRRIAGTGGIVGIGFWDTAVCGEDAAAIAKAIRYAANTVGINAVALGSDFDGAVKTPFDVSGMALITEALLQENFSEDEIKQIMGGNVLRLLGENLPE